LLLLFLLACCCLIVLFQLGKVVRLVDASWVWTEPHSRRLKLKLTVQKEVFAGTILQQVFVVEFVVAGEQCKDCEQFEAKDTWTAVVQVCA
jgi:nonsense-mediated mRNA decay protein 3